MLTVYKPEGIPWRSRSFMGTRTCTRANGHKAGRKKLREGVRKQESLTHKKEHDWKTLFLFNLELDVFIDETMYHYPNEKVPCCPLG